MDGQPTVVTNQNNKDAPADLVVLTVTPEELSVANQKAVLAIEWYQPDGTIYPNREGVIFVRWEQLQPIYKGDPEAPADHGFDPLTAVEYIAFGFRRRGAMRFYNA